MRCWYVASSCANLSLALGFSGAVTVTNTKRKGRWHTQTVFSKVEDATLK